MGTVRRIDRRGHQKLPNNAVYDDRLSYRAMGLLLMLLARPAHATADIRSLAGPGREGRDALLRARKELIATGYVASARWRHGGQWVSGSVVRDVPMKPDEARQALVDKYPTIPGNPTPENQDSAQSTTLPTEGHSSYYVEETSAGTRECEHGHPDGAELHPKSGRPRCPQCRGQGLAREAAS